jgi:N-acetylneuraminate synthase/sialic acid synthase
MKTKTYLIAEMGCNHGGDLATAMRLVDIAADAEVCAVKLQIRDVSVCEDGWEKPYVGPHSYGDTYWEHRRALELTPKEYVEVIKHARMYNLDVGASVWGMSALDIAQALDLDWLKIPSALLTNSELVAAAAEVSFPVILSAGMSTQDEVDAALDAAEAGSDHNDVWLLHCTSSYPCPNEDVHLNAMAEMQNLYASETAKIGISGHWKGIQIDAAAVGMGAEVIERHYTYDRTAKGTDHAASLGPSGLVKWVRDVRAVEAALGERKIQVLPCEESARAKLRGDR